MLLWGSANSSTFDNEKLVWQLHQILQLNRLIVRRHDHMSVPMPRFLLAAILLLSLASVAQSGEYLTGTAGGSARGVIFFRTLPVDFSPRISLPSRPGL